MKPVVDTIHFILEFNGISKRRTVVTLPYIKGLYVCNCRKGCLTIVRCVLYEMLLNRTVVSYLLTICNSNQLYHLEAYAAKRIHPSSSGLTSFGFLLYPWLPFPEKLLLTHYHLPAHVASSVRHGALDLGLQFLCTDSGRQVEMGAGTLLWLARCNGLCLTFYLLRPVTALDTYINQNNNYKPSPLLAVLPLHAPETPTSPSCPQPSL